VSRRIRIVILAVLMVALSTAGLAVFALVDDGGSTDSPIPGLLLTKPVLAQGISFPDDQAGISAYIQLDSASVDFDTIITSVFTDMISVGDNYIIGTTSVEREVWASSLITSIEVRIYVEDSGLLLAYLTSDLELAELFRWTGWDPLGSTLDTVLGEALGLTAKAFGQPFDPTSLSWYHWAFPDATNFAAAARAGTGNMFIALPASPAIILDGPSYSWHSLRRDITFSGNTLVKGQTGSLTLSKEGASPITLEASLGIHVTQFSVQAVVLDVGAIYTFAASDGSGGGGAGQHRLGLAVLYSQP